MESVRRELDAYNNTNPTITYSRISSSRHNIYTSLQHRHSDSSLDGIDYHTRKRLPPKHRDSADRNHGVGGESPFYGAHMMHMLLEQQARVYSKENEMLRKEMDHLRVSNPYLCCMIGQLTLYGIDRI